MPLPDDGFHKEDGRNGERGPAPHRSDRQVVFDRTEFKCENTK